MSPIIAGDPEADAFNCVLRSSRRLDDLLESHSVRVADADACDFVWLAGLVEVESGDFLGTLRHSPTYEEQALLDVLRCA